MSCHVYTEKLPHGNSVLATVVRQLLHYLYIYKGREYRFYKNFHVNICQKLNLNNTYLTDYKNGGMMIMFTAYLNKGKSKGKPSNVKEYRLGTDYIDVSF